MQGCTSTRVHTHAHTHAERDRDFERQGREIFIYSTAYLPTNVRKQNSVFSVSHKGMALAVADVQYV